MIRLPFYPFLIAALVVFDTAISSGEPPGSLVRPVFVAVGIALFVFIVCAVIVRDRHRAAYVAALAVALLLWVPLLTIALGLVIILSVAAEVVRRRPLPAVAWPAITRSANAIGLIVAVLAVGSAAFAGLLAPTPVVATARMEPATIGVPDIYVVILDGHPRGDTVDALGGDGRAFADVLEGEGLEVSPASRSLYNMTSLSLASMFEMRTVQDAAAARGVGGTDSRRHARLMSDLISSGSGLAMLHTAGYEIVAIPTESTSTAVLGADRYLDSGQLTELETSILSSSVLRWLAPGPLRQFVGDQRRDRLASSLDSVVTLASERSSVPRFVLAHLALPHLPPAYDDTGEPVDGWPCYPQTCDPDSLGWTQPLGARRAAQLANVKAIDARVVELVRQIRASATAEPVIVVLSDHGARLDPADEPEMLRNLFAASTPGFPGLFGNEPVVGNVLPTLLRTYAGRAVPDQPDTSYWLDIGAARSRGLLELTPITVDQASPTASTAP